jgi:hypothetical protein
MMTKQDTASRVLSKKATSLGLNLVNNVVMQIDQEPTFPLIKGDCNLLNEDINSEK